MRAKLVEGALHFLPKRANETAKEDMMSGELPLLARNDPRWRDVATGRISRPWNTLAMKIMMTRILRETSADPSTTNIAKCSDEIYAFFEKNHKIAQADLALICR